MANSAPARDGDRADKARYPGPSGEEVHKEREYLSTGLYQLKR